MTGLILMKLMPIGPGVSKANATPQENLDRHNSG